MEDQRAFFIFGFSACLVPTEAAKKDISARYTMTSIRESNLGHSEKPDYAVVKATISFIRQAKRMYICPKWCGVVRKYRRLKTVSSTYGASQAFFLGVLSRSRGKSGNVAGQRACNGCLEAVVDSSFSDVIFDRVGA